VRRFGLSASGAEEPDVGSSQPAESPLAMHELFPATLASVGAARRAVRRFAAELDVDLDGVMLAVTEAVANVVVHAYVDRAPGTVELSGEASAAELELVVRDHGGGLAAGGASRGAGLGLPIIRRLAQRVELDDAPDGVVLTMRFPRGGA